MADKGLKLTFKRELWHKLGESSFTTYIPILKTSRAEVLFIGTWGSSLNAFILQAKNAGLFERMKAFGMISEDSAIALGDQIPTGLFGHSRAAFNYFAAKSAAGKEFVDDYHKKYNMYPGGFSFCAYDSVIAWADAVEKAGSFDSEKVVDALKGLKFSGPRGEMFIRDFDNQLNSPVCMGPRVFKEEYGFAVIEPTIIIPAEDLWLSEDEVKALQSQ